MTFEKMVKKFLVDNGMFDTQAEQVFENLIVHVSQESIRGRWVKM